MGRVVGLISVAFWLVAGPLPSTAIEVSVRVTIPDHPVDAGVSDLPHVEPHLAAHPADPNRLAAGAIVVSADADGPWSCAAFASEDRGRSWTRHDFDMQQCIDPWATIARDGTLFLAAIEIRRDQPEDDRFRLLLFRSRDAGKTWDPGLDLGTSHDHEMVTEEPSGDLLLVSRRASRSPEGHRRHRVGIQRVSNSGRAHRELSQVAVSNLALNPTGVVGLSDGTLVISLIDFQRNVDDFEALGRLSQPRAWALRSKDASAFSEPLFLSEGCGATDEFAGYPALAVDSSDGPFRDRLYHLCVRAGFDGLSLSTSADGGEIWSDPRRIDGARDGAVAHVRTPMLAVNGNGVVAAAWYDRRNDPEHRCQDLYFTFSSDGGESFEEPLRVSTETSCPRSEANGRVARSWPMGGDYGSLTAAADRAFHVLWADSRSGRFQLRHAALEVVSDSSSPAEP